MARLKLRTGLRRFIRPETIWSLRRVLARQIRPPQFEPGEMVKCELPWGSEILVQHDEYIGSVILSWLVFELGVCELISRLSSPGEVMIDVGANIGQMTSLLAACTGPEGQVLSFEPHPVIFGRLEKNVGFWTSELGHSKISLFRTALGSERGTASLKEEPNFDVNPGLSSLVGSSEASHAHSVRVERLDEIEAAKAPAGVMKLDVEDYELEVLKGATGLMEASSIRDIVYEDHEGYPSQLSDFLERFGYTVFSLRPELMRPHLVPSTGQDRTSPNFLATLEPDRALSQFKGPGYSALRRKLP